MKKGRKRKGHNSSSESESDANGTKGCREEPMPNISVVSGAEEEYESSFPALPVRSENQLRQGKRKGKGSRTSSDEERGKKAAKGGMECSGLSLSDGVNMGSEVDDKVIEPQVSIPHTKNSRDGLLILEELSKPKEICKKFVVKIKKMSQWDLMTYT